MYAPAPAPATDGHFIVLSVSLVIILGVGLAVWYYYFKPNDDGDTPTPTTPDGKTPTPPPQYPPPATTTNSEPVGDSGTTWGPAGFEWDRIAEDDKCPGPSVLTKAECTLLAKQNQTMFYNWGDNHGWPYGCFTYKVRRSGVTFPAMAWNPYAPSAHTTPAPSICKEVS